MTDVIERGYLNARKREKLRREIDDALDMIRDHWDDATHPPGTEPSGRRPAPGSRPPLPIEYASVVDEAERVLRSWAALVVDERAAKPRRHLADGRAVACFLALHAEWLAAHDTGGDAASELMTQARRVRDLALGRRARKFQIGRCPEVTEEGAVCDGALWAVIRQGLDHDGMLPDRVACDRCGTIWAPHQWTALGRRLVGTLDRRGAERLIARLSAVRYTG